MRLPSGSVATIARTFLKNPVEWKVLGVLGTEERSIAIPSHFRDARERVLWEIHDPPHGFPNYGELANQRLASRKATLDQNGVVVRTSRHPLLISEDDLLDLAQEKDDADSIVLDITSMPKRYFCFLLRRFLKSDVVRNLVVTYTHPASGGYHAQHLAFDPLPCESLPGYSAPLSMGNSTLVISVGFEPLAIRPLVEVYHDRARDAKLVLPFSGRVEDARKAWRTVMHMVEGQADQFDARNIETVASWDTETVYSLLTAWDNGNPGATLAPFGPKPHSLAMALFAIAKDYGLIYSQPQSYHPDYSRGVGPAYAYVAKWRGIPCFDRP